MATTHNPQSPTAIVPATTARPTSFSAMLEKWKPEIQRALPSHLSADRMCRVALTAVRRNPKLAECSALSIFAATIQAAQLGLEPDLLGRAYLVPYRVKRGGDWISEAQFVPGWKGLVELLNRDGRASVRTGAVFDGDEFDYELGTLQRLCHRPCGEDDPNKLTHAYAIGQVRGQETPYIEVWPAQKIFRRRDRFNKVGENHYSFSHPEMYARKVVLLQVLKYLPLSAELSQAVALDYAAQTKGQALDLSAAVDGSWAPPMEEEGPSPNAGPEVTVEAEAAAKQQESESVPSTHTKQSQRPTRSAAARAQEMPEF